MEKKVNYFAIILSIIAVISVFLPWVRASSSISYGGYNSSGGISASGIYSIGGIFGLIIAITGCILVIASVKWSYITGILNLLTSIACMFGWMKSSGHSGNGSWESDITPQYGLYIFAAASLLFIISTAAFSYEDESEEENHNENIASKEKSQTDEITLLNDLKGKGILSTEEYNEKILQVEDNRKNAVFNSKLKENTEPMLKPLIELKEKGLLSDEEFNNKKNEIIETQKKLLKEWSEWVENKSKMSVISPDILNTLTEIHKHQLERCLNFMKMTDVIVLHDATVKIIDAERWKKINEQGVAERFKVIYTWNI